MDPKFCSQHLVSHENILEREQEREGREILRVTKKEHVIEVHEAPLSSPLEELPGQGLQISVTKVGQVFPLEVACHVEGNSEISCSHCWNQLRLVINYIFTKD